MMERALTIENLKDAETEETRKGFSFICSLIMSSRLLR